ncbi:hypothetical protein BDV95DRAFT_494743 [Massariosphaeria phaeospora]|uniref:P-loop containing nucleoside triphosphate hydrolase protein n=1 Tax=Massariosphaeria phaeospora TaxID=100035 RepID=A0A7C8I8V1_9PLEO|nr:hypothetical protein BDV95DRAFT_494743 [Massariosphaeria phaeospora]
MPTASNKETVSEPPSEDSEGSEAEDQQDLPPGPDYDQINLLMPDKPTDGDKDSSSLNAEIQHAPLLDGSMITADTAHLLPQYGFFGMRAKSPLFFNTNVPFSAFICGVQGSGKSHTTSCILENALIPSRSLGRLESPLSALVLSYGHFGSGGVGFSISEAAYLVAPHRDFPKHPSVKRVTVLVSPSNFHNIAPLYTRIKNVTVLPMKLKPERLDVNTMLTLMAVDLTAEPPLYLVQVQGILRSMAEEGRGFNYMQFKKRLEQCNFNPAQKQMLDMRLGQLDSFLDLGNTFQEPQYRPGEITIMDMSCPFVDANTACIMFKLGLQRYLQSRASGKMVVLDEAHKYMLDLPGTHALNSELLQVIRLQRHYGSRVIISTQEPTLLTDLIALCSVSVIHRFSSPEWFAALKRHIPMASQSHETLLRDIEGLKTGTALAYSPNAVFGRDGEGALMKGMGTFVRVVVRKRATWDGGVSVLASA